LLFLFEQNSAQNFVLCSSILFYPAEFRQNSIPAAELWTLIFTHNTTLALPIQTKFCLEFCFMQQHFVLSSRIMDFVIHT
jgi:hypothetical protein